MLRTYFLLSAALLFCQFRSEAQQDFYDPGRIAEVRITFTEKNWRFLLDSLMNTSNGVSRLIAEVSVDGQVYHKAGVRYKGYSSWNQGGIKNPFNIELDYTFKNQNHRGYTKLKLGNVIHDPSFVREALAYEIAGKYMPASKAAYARLYVNDTLIGLYSNVESVDKLFISNFFPSGKNTFFKGDPINLIFPFGQNANLALSHGNDSLDYFPYYKMESDYGWKDLYDLIYILNEQTDSLSNVLNIDRTLWMHAFNYAILNLDSYIAYAQNYYMYRDDNGRFNPFVWDLNMSFGSFRASDASNHFQGLSIPQMKVLDPLQHLSFSISPRPLMTKLFQQDRYRKMYLAHMRTILNENIRNHWYLDRAEELQAMILEAVQQDTNKFYSGDDFVNNLNSTVGGTGSMTLYPGITDLMEARLLYLDSFPGFQGAPEISDILNWPIYPRRGKECRINARVGGASTVTLSYRCSSNSIFQTVPMFDDGNHQDSLAGDHIYGTSLQLAGSTLQFYIYAENDSAAVFSPERAAYEYHSIQLLPQKGDICLNEIMVLNQQTFTDLHLDYLPWIELLNTSGEDISLKDMFLSDEKSSLTKWSFPDTTVKAGSFLIIWSAQDTSAAGLFSNVDLQAKGGKLLLSNVLNEIVDSVTYGQQLEDKSFGRYPNGYGPFVYMEPTFSKNNFWGTTPQSGFLVYPNPVSGMLNIEFIRENGPVHFEIFSSQGQKLMHDILSSGGEVQSPVLQQYDISSLSQGCYVIRIKAAGSVVSKKFIKY